MFQSSSQHFAATQDSATRAEILSAFSFALDLTEGQPAGHSVRAAWIGTFLGLAWGLRGRELSDCTYAVLLKDLGCSSNAARVAALFLGDDRKLKHQFKTIGPEGADFIAFIERAVGIDCPEDERSCAIDTLKSDAGPILTGFIDTRCNQGARIARSLRFSDDVAEAIACLDEHWDGHGMPLGLSGEDIPLVSRIALLAQVADVFFMTGGPALALAEVQARSGTWLDPDLVALFADLASDPRFWEELGSADIETRLHAMAAVNDTVPVDEAYLDAIAAAFGEVIDAKSPFTSGHSARVGSFADAIARELGFDDAPRRRLKRAAMLHDVGKLGVSNRILDKPGKLDEAEWADMRQHAAFTADILGRISVLSDMAMIAAAHHERLDGTGYPLGLDHALISLETRIITAADIYDALTADRPYRAAMSCERALMIMEEECGTSVDPAVLQALKAVVRRTA